MDMSGIEENEIYRVRLLEIKDDYVLAKIVER
jgi:hypothetical protein